MGGVFFNRRVELRGRVFGLRVEDLLIRVLLGDIIALVDGTRSVGLCLCCQSRRSSVRRRIGLRGWWFGSRVGRRGEERGVFTRRFLSIFYGMKGLRRAQSSFELAW